MKTKNISVNELKKLKSVSTETIKKEASIYIRKKVEGFKTKDLKKSIKINVDVDVRESKNLLSQYNKYRNKMIKNIKEEKYSQYVKKAQQDRAIPKEFKEWWKESKKDIELPETAKKVYEKGVYVYDNKKLDEYGNPKIKKVKGVTALRKQVIKLAKYSSKDFKKLQFLETYIHYAKQVFTTQKSREILEEIIRILEGLSADELNSLSNSVLIIQELYNPNDTDEYAQQILNELKFNLGLK